jgi:hypothetical protein
MHTTERRRAGWVNGLFAGGLSLALILAPGAGYSASAWFGLKMPPRRAQQSQTYRKAYETPALAPLSLRLPEADDPYSGIEGEEVHRYIEDIVRITEEHRPAGEKYWGRIAGSAAERATADYVADRFREFGLVEVRTEPVQGGAQWWPIDWSVTLIGNPAYGEGTEDYTLTSAFPAVQLGTGAMRVDGIEAELIYVGLGQPVDMLNRDLKGKIAVVRSELQPDPFFQSARGHIEDIVHAGAIGVITIMDAPGNHQYALERLGAPDVPCFVVGGDDGRFLEAALVATAGISAVGESPGTVLRARLDMDAEVRPSWQGKNVIGLIPGTIDEYVVISAHLDGYFDSANDNAGGVAAALALARYFADAPSMKRTLLFVGTSAHHEFSDGSRAFIAAHPEILEKTVLVFNIEHPSSIKSYYRGPLKLERVTVPGQLIVTTSQSKRSLTISNGNPLLLSIYQDGVDRYGLVVDAMVERRPTGDAFDFFRAGVPVVQILDANLWFHSTGDRVDTIHANGLERATRLYAFALSRIDQAGWDELRRK